MAFFDDALTARISAQAEAMKPGRALLTLIAGLFFALGWLVAKTFGVLWLVVAWSAAAVKVGWQEGRQPRRSPLSG